MNVLTVAACNGAGPLVVEPVAKGHCRRAQSALNRRSGRSAVSVTAAAAASGRPTPPLACPACKLPVAELPDECSRCKGYFPREFRNPSSAAGPNNPLADLTMQAAGLPPAWDAADNALRQDLFRTPLVSLAYERLLPAVWSAGLRDTGIEDEKADVRSFFLGLTGAAVDVSCGTGIMARHLAASGQFSSVLALDYSENMLREAFAGSRREGLEALTTPGGSLQIVRGDAMSLPLEDGSCDAIYAGAAMHCWPSAEAGLAGIHAALKPGGKLYATTFLRPFPDLVFRFFTTAELEAMMAAAGFEPSKTQVTGKGVYATLKAVK